MVKEFSDREVISVGEEVTIFVDMGCTMRTGETVSAAPTLSEVGSNSYLTLADIAVIASDTTIPECAPLYGSSETLIETNTGFLFTVIASTAGVHQVKATIVTTGVTPAQTLIRHITLSAV